MEIRELTALAVDKQLEVCKGVVEEHGASMPLHIHTALTELLELAAAERARRVATVSSFSESNAKVRQMATENSMLMRQIVLAQSTGGGSSSNARGVTSVASGVTNVASGVATGVATGVHSGVHSMTNLANRVIPLGMFGLVQKEQ